MTLSVAECVDTLCDIAQRANHRHAIAQLSQCLEDGSGYIEEAVRSTIARLLTQLLPTARDDATLDAMARILAACSGPMACKGKVSSFCYDGIEVRVQEGALSDGLGAKVWSLSNVMCRELVDHPELVRGQVVLEIGSGTGLCGILTAKLGASQVLLTDHEGLPNLRTCMHMNVAPGCPTNGKQQQQQHTTLVEGSFPAELLSHPLDSDDDAASLGAAAAVPPAAAAATATEATSPAATGPTVGAAATAATAVPAGARGAAALSSSWEVDNMAVRLLDWADSLAALNSCTAMSEPAQADLAPAGCSEDLEGTAGSLPPMVAADIKFPVLIGNEVMYEVAHAELVAAVIAHRLAPHGKALLCCAVRQFAVFNAFARFCALRGLRHRTKAVAPPAAGEQGLLAHADAYEGGFLLIAVDHVAAPALDWHRDDWEERAEL